MQQSERKKSTEKKSKTQSEASREVSAAWVNLSIQKKKGSESDARDSDMNISGIPQKEKKAKD